MGFYSNYRVKRLGLDGVFDFMFSPADHDIPTSVAIDDVRNYPATHYEFRYTKQEHTPKGSFKPDTNVLQRIVTTLGIEKSECVYVGESVTKDVAMAKDANIDDVFAKYGRAQDTDAYELLKEVTHWSGKDVEREKKIGEREVTPTITLDENFAQLLQHFEFEDWNG